MHLAFDIFQGIGIAAAIGIRPFLPSLAAGALAAGGVELHFDHGAYAFLASAPFLVAMLVATVALIALGHGRTGAIVRARGAVSVLSATALVLGALFFAATLVRAGHSAWPGWVAGVICAGVGIAASYPFLLRLRSRLDADAAALGLPLLADGSALLICVLSVLAPPVGVLTLLALCGVLAQGRGRELHKYAGLRILR